MRASCTYATPESTNHKTIDQDGCEQVLIRSFDGGLTWPSETLSPVFRRAELDEHVRAVSWIPGRPERALDPRSDGFCLVAGYGILEPAIG